MLRKLLPLPESKASRIIGYVDGEIRGRLHGWAFDPTHPSNRLTVSVMSPSGPPVHTFADRYRADVHQSGLGDGYYGFSVPLRWSDAASVRVVCTASGVELAGGLPASAKKAAGKQMFAVDSYTLHDDSLSGGHIRGWAVDTSEPDLRRALRLRCKGSAVAQQRATLYRADIVDGRCDGYHGFWFSLPRLAAPLSLEDVRLGAVFQIPF